MSFSWRANPTVEKVTVWPETHPVTVGRSLSLFALYGLSNLATKNPSLRLFPQSAFNNTRYAGDPGPLQTFSRVYGFPSTVRVGGKSLPSAEGGSVDTSGVLGSIGGTVG